MSKGYMTDAASGKQKSIVERKMRALRDREEADLKWVMSSPAGRRFLWKLIGSCKVFESIFSVSSADMGHRAGRQDFGHDLIQLLELVTPEPYLMMLHEAQAERLAEIREKEAFHAQSKNEEEETH